MTATRTGHADAFKGVGIDFGGAVGDVIEAPACGYQTITWAAEHPMRGWESGVMLVSREPYGTEPYGRNVVAEILWSRGFVGDYRVVVAG